MPLRAIATRADCLVCTASFLKGIGLSALSRLGVCGWLALDLRTWLSGLALLGVLLGLGSSAAKAQGEVTCVASAGVPSLVRAEGVAELVADLILSCTGGAPTPFGQPIPLENVQITLNTNITSRIVGPGNVSEALLLIDEPFPASDAVPSTSSPTDGQTLVQLGCLANNDTNCAITSVGPGIGVSGSYNGAPGQYNTFQGTQTGAVRSLGRACPLMAQEQAALALFE